MASNGLQHAQNNSVCAIYIPFCQKNVALLAGMVPIAGCVVLFCQFQRKTEKYYYHQNMVLWNMFYMNKLLFFLFHVIVGSPNYTIFMI